LKASFVKEKEPEMVESKRETFALVIENRDTTLRGLSFALESLGIRTRHAQTLREAEEIIKQGETPQLVFIDARLADGTWLDVVRLASRRARTTKVIVVSPTADTRLYLEALEGGAFDCVAPPFAGADLPHVVSCALRHESCGPLPAGRAVYASSSKGSHRVENHLDEQRTANHA
jgi:DNA-binding NtrC family response regulator